MSLCLNFRAVLKGEPYIVSSPKVTPEKIFQCADYSAVTARPMTSLTTAVFASA